MRLVAYFWIRGNEHLKTACAEHPEMPDIEGLLGPFSYEIEFAQRATWDVPDYCLGVKLAFVAYVKCCMTDAPTRQRIFGELKVEEPNFDRWWELEAVLGCDHVSYLVQEVAQGGGLPELEANAKEWFRSMLPSLLAHR